ncbi:hypothetical protein Lac3_26230 [Claveliimonas bilis]|nr:hypothetical protein Lac3_26230 [Claveliimonas bilis]
MPKQGIKPEKLALEIQKQLKEYVKEAEETVWDIAEEVSKEAVSKLRKESPKRKGKYARSWTVSEDARGVIIHSRSPEYRLTHLLEKGHALKRGGRKVGESPKYPHIQKVEEESVKDYIEKVERRLQS